MPTADGTLVMLPEEIADMEKPLPHLLALFDMASTAHHAAVTAAAQQGAIDGRLTIGRR